MLNVVVRDVNRTEDAAPLLHKLWSWAVALFFNLACSLRIGAASLWYFSFSRAYTMSDAIDNSIVENV